MKTRVAVLGGGVGAMTTAYELTRTKELRDRFDVSVYQLGWRIGGKGASGRNASEGQRIEEHGLHIWFGFYENAFNVMKEAYAELDRPEGAPLRRWDDAFKKHSYIVLMERLGDEWFPWTFDFRTNDIEPGTGKPFSDLWTVITNILDYIASVWHGSDVAQTSPPPPPEADVPEWIARLGASVGDTTPHPASTLLEHARALARSLGPDPSQHGAEHHHAIVWLIEAFMKVVWLFVRGDVEKNAEVKKLWVSVNIAGSAVAGMLADGVLFKGFDSIDRWDFREWLGMHGANETTQQSAPLRGIYDLVFGYLKGNVKDGRFAAGTAMRGTLRMLFEYRGAIMWEMQAGMGDTVFTPFYDVLKKRGVRFHFFHEVKNLAVEGKKVVRIDFEKQVKLAPGVTEYDPYVYVKGLACWPSQPRYEQILHGEELRASGINLESSWAPRWKDAEDFSLHLGEHFDAVVIGMSVGALKDTCAELAKANPAFQQMIDEVKTTQTQAMQLWLTPDTTGLGWITPTGISEKPVLGAYVEPIDTWADMSHLLPREDWKKETPGDAAYFCGPLEDPPVIPPFSDHEFPARMLAQYKERARAFVMKDLQLLWPKATTASGALDLNLLVTEQGGTGPERFDAQYFRVNLDPTERYVLSVQKSTQYRLRADQSGFDNVVLSGDWTYNGLNAGCVEAAVMGGLQAARALHGLPRVILGETDR